MKILHSEVNLIIYYIILQSISIRRKHMQTHCENCITITEIQRWRFMGDWYQAVAFPWCVCMQFLLIDSNFCQTGTSLFSWYLHLLFSKWFEVQFMDCCHHGMAGPFRLQMEVSCNYIEWAANQEWPCCLGSLAWG